MVCLGLPLNDRSVGESKWSLSRKVIRIYSRKGRCGMQKNKKLIIVGAGEFGQIAYEYFTDDSEYEVVAFAVEQKYKTIDEMNGLSVIDFERISNIYPPNKFDVFVAVTYVQLNRARRRLVDVCMENGYHCASYVSSKSFIGRGVKLGENVFIFENNAVEHQTEIGTNTIIWGGGNISHSCTIEDNCWLAPCVAVAGFSKIGSASFIGSHATIGDNVNIANDTLVGAGSVIYKNVKNAGGMYVGVPARRLEKSSYEYFGIS